ncbi:Energy-coupling factor transporter transmembrane protein EcfT [Candidatus Brocadiaceae bacterium B188]|nr:hypothetical protein [Candidatus Brocadia sapporoensis]QQR67676.1 MAG: hypothetical protein IPI25_05600 [Candidatus Brocadia sp.]RZV59067.1 MAG: hypothetical protein EX330_04095 [Candidatus Brocadia sp. BROELEC01]TWU52506.1 Energy-coupling factor transporter transmembrane protein EcfT [Candidatus Brocadiaceae bacterium B188]
MNIAPPSTRLGTILILSVFIGLGLLDNLLYLFICLVIINLFALLVVRSMFITAWRCKGILVFFVLTGATLLWTKEGRSLAPALITKMLVMWLWSVFWITWVGFGRILLTFEKLKIPQVLVHIIAFTSRFLPILSERLKMMLAAQASRGAKKGVHPLHLYNLAGGIGCLLVSSFEQAENVERAMQSRGFAGRYPLLVEDNDVIAVPYGSLTFLFLFTSIVWFGVIYNVLCNSCPPGILSLSKW